MEQPVDSRAPMLGHPMSKGRGRTWSFKRALSIGQTTQAFNALLPPQSLTLEYLNWSNVKIMLDQGRLIISTKKGIYHFYHLCKGGKYCKFDINKMMPKTKKLWIGLWSHRL